MSTTVSEAPVKERRGVASARPLRVGLFGGFGIGNFGNDASLEAVLSFLRKERPDLELSAICTNPAVVTQIYNLPAFSTVLRPKGIWRKLDTLLLRQPSAWANWANCLWMLGRYDVVLVCGTGVFDDFRDTPLGWPSRILRWCLAARLRGVRIAFISVGAGPILNPISRLLFKHAAQLAQHRSYRDANSREYMQSIGVDEGNSRVLPDLAFLLPSPPMVQRPHSAALTIGVGIMNYRGWRGSDAVYADYLAAHENLIEWIEGQGHKVRILIGQTPTDLVAVRDLEARMGRPLMRPEDEALSSIHDVMRAVAATDLVVASRYHVQIAALKMARPLISLSYGPKNDALMELAGLKTFVQDVHRIDLGLLKDQISTLAGDRAHYGDIVRARVEAMEAELHEAMFELDLVGE